MRSKEQIIDALNQDYADRAGPKPMSEMEWAYNQGSIEALEWVLDVLGEETGDGQKDINYILEGADNGTITKALKRLSEKYGFGRKGDAVDSKNDSVRDGWLYAPQECAP